MHPLLCTITIAGHGWEVSVYRVAFLVSAALTVAIAVLIAARLGIVVRDALFVYGAAALALPVGARLWHIATNPSIYRETPAAVWSLDPTGFAMFGGVAAAALAGVVAARATRSDLWRLADAAAPALGIGIAVMRLGCFANGCCFGVPTAGPLGVTFPAGSYAHLWEMAHGYVGMFAAPLPVHPTQLYEGAGALACAAIAGVLIARRAPVGVAFLTFVGAFALVRWGNWALRAHPDTLADPGLYWWVYPAVAVLCGGLVWVRIRVARRAAECAVIPAANDAGHPG